MFGRRIDAEHDNGFKMFGPGQYACRRHAFDNAGHALNGEAFRSQCCRKIKAGDMACVEACGVAYHGIIDADGKGGEKNKRGNRGYDHER